MIDFVNFFISTFVRPKMTTELTMERMIIGHSVSELSDELVHSYVQYLRGEKCNKFSTRGDNSHFTITRDLLSKELHYFDYKRRIDKIVQQSPSRYLNSEIIGILRFLYVDFTQFILFYSIFQEL